MNFCVFSTEYPSSTTDFDYPRPQPNKKCWTNKDIAMSSRTKVASAKLYIESYLYYYTTRTRAGEDIYFSNGTEKKNAHTNGQIIIKRYDNGSFRFQQIINITTATEYNVPIGIFINMTDNTIIRVELSSTKFKFNLTETNEGAFANVRVKLVADTYYYSLLDIVEQIRQQTRKYYNSHGNNPLFDLTTDSDKLAVLRNTIAPEISFTGVDVYTALYQLFSYIDAVPTIDSDGKLTFDYLNNNNQSSIQITKSDEKISLTDQNYTNKLVAVYQKGKQDNAIIVPAKNKTARIGTKGYGVPSSNDYVIKLPKPIDYLDKVIIDTNATWKVNFNLYLDYEYPSDRIFFEAVEISYGNSLDITDQIIETQLYETLGVYSDNYDAYQQRNNCLTFSKGSKEIDFLGNCENTQLQEEKWKWAINSANRFLLGVPINSEKTDGYNGFVSAFGTFNKFNIKYNVEYHAIFDGKVEQVSSTNKYEGETYVNQETSNVSLNRMGNNLQGLIAKLGNEVENITLGVSSYGSRMKAGSLWVDDDGNRFIANVVRTTFSTSEDNVIVEAEFTKNFNMLSQYTKIDQEKRFYEISPSITNKGYDNITEYLLFTYDSSLSVSSYESALTETALHTIIEKTLLNSGTYKTLDYATFQAFTHENDTNPTYSDHIVVPMHIYGSGNSLCFEMDFDNSINAGDRLTGSSNLYTKTTLYTEANGFADRVKVVGRNSTNDGYFGENYPAVPYSAVSGDTEMFDIDYKYFKNQTRFSTLIMQSHF